MNIISSRAEIQPLVDEAIVAYKSTGISACTNRVYDAILKRKVRYPILEYAAGQLCKAIPAADQVELLDGLISLTGNGSEVIAGKILQLRLNTSYDESIAKAIEYIIRGGNWLCCDTIGERVMGHALLTMPERTIPVLEQLSRHESKWVVRSVGTAVHYAVKKGLKKNYVDKVFGLLLSLAGSTDFHIKKG